MIFILSQQSIDECSHPVCRVYKAPLGKVRFPILCSVSKSTYFRRKSNLSLNVFHHVQHLSVEIIILSFKNIQIMTLLIDWNNNILKIMRSFWVLLFLGTRPCYLFMAPAPITFNGPDSGSKTSDGYGDVVFLTTKFKKSILLNVISATKR